MKWWERPDPITHFNLPDAEVVIDDVHKIAFIYSHDAGIASDAYDELEKHLRQRGYYLYVSTAPAQSSLTPAQINHRGQR